ncbi:cupredoxin domain-containing protein [Candidatus Nitrosotenuis cloacae]|uniref:cupredoxin domain-containing protein n=1 Tax=Candidatus Nitrosotenuis cloacae TaxID=1603555 RepID=UPI00069BB864|nr:plastocyanin/azurin family copper-binding protein [Candidatus Nitrosotenuis cloacae]
MNKTVLAGIAIFALLGAVLAVPMMQSVDAAETKEKKTVKKETKKTTKKTTKPSSKASSEVTVNMAKGSDNESCEKGNKCYSPFEAKVTKGGTVTWVNKDTAAHTATSGTIKNGPDGKFDTGLLQSGEKFSQKFDAAGKYDYFCLVHPWMKGKVTVS